MRKNPHVRICGGLGSATTLVYPTSRELQVDGDGVLPLDGDRLTQDPHVLPFVLVPVLIGVVGIRVVDVQVLHVAAVDREPPSALLVVPHRHAGDGGLPRADRVPARADQVDHVAERRHRHPPVRIVGQDRGSGEGPCSADHPKLVDWPRGEW